MPVDELLRRAEILRTADEVDAFLQAHPSCAIFKAGGCRRTDDALEVLESLLAPRGDVPLALIRVTEARAASQRVTERTALKHESPQLLLLKDGRLIWACDNWRILRDPVAEALAAHFPPPRTS